MLKHIVMMKMKDSLDKQENQKKLVEMLEGLSEHISAIEHLEIGNNFSGRPTAMDIVLVSEFKDEAALDEYRVHPEHVRVLDYIKEVIEEARVVDYWTKP